MTRTHSGKGQPVTKDIQWKWKHSGKKVKQWLITSNLETLAPDPGPADPRAKCWIKLFQINKIKMPQDLVLPPMVSQKYEIIIMYITYVYNYMYSYTLSQD